jgi:hypothetical protein
MNTHRSTLPSSRGLRFALALVVLIVLVSCAIPSIGPGSDSLRETSIALGVQSTSVAMTEATLQALQTNSALPAPTQPAVENDLQATLNAQSTTISQQQLTAAAPTATRVEPTSAQATATPEPAEPEEIGLQNWKMTNLHETTRCGDRAGFPCWEGSGTELSLELEEPIQVDASWSRPHLVFSHTYVFQADANIYVNASGRWEVLRIYPKGEGRWTDVALDLTKYKGKEILLKFTIVGPTSSPGGVWWRPDKPAPNSRWSIQNIRLVPNYKQ